VPESLSLDFDTMVRQGTTVSQASFLLPRLTNGTIPRKVFLQAYPSADAVFFQLGTSAATITAADSVPLPTDGTPLIVWCRGGPATYVHVINAANTGTVVAVAIDG